MSQEEGKRMIAATTHSLKATGKIGGDFQLQQDPHFLSERLNLFQNFYNEYSSYLSQKPKEPIQILLPDGNIKEGTSWESTPLDIARSISRKLATDAVAAKVKYSRRLGQDEVVSADQHDDEEGLDLGQWEIIDMTRPLEGDCEMQLLTFEDKEGKIVFWHSSAHILGASIEKTFGAYLCTGPPVDPGFFYDAYMGQSSVSQDHFDALNKAAQELIQQKQPFERIIVTKEQALQLFAYNPFKVQLITNKIPDGGKTTAYRCGYFIDLCTGPHLPNTVNVRAFSVTRNSSAYWLAKAENDTLQRVYGVSFPSKKELSEYIHLQQEAAKRDHRNVGRNQDLYFWHPFSPGSTFFLPHGAHIFTKLVDFVRAEYKVRGFTEVVTPNIYNLDLWKTSGHYQNYKDAMFLFSVENQEFGMKPMNCPGHCLMFRHTQRTYRELPIRYADFGVLHRNELSGALTGLTRVRRFQQDDAHIFCRQDQVEEEIMGALDFLSYIYNVFGFTFELELSTKPEKALGSDEIWRNAENQLQRALDRSGLPWKLNPGDGAFYGPKIDIMVLDALKRKHQCATIQLDINLPARFDLQYRVEDMQPVEQELIQYEDMVEKQLKPGFRRPIIIHRAILGSVERMIAILTENYGGKWPFWLSPRQVAVLPISDGFIPYASQVANRLLIEGYMVNVDQSNVTLNKKIRNAQLEQYNFIAVVGQEEVNSNTVDVREREANRSMGKFSLNQFIALLKQQEPPKSQAWRNLMDQSAFEDVVEIKKTVSMKELNQRLELNTFLSGEQLGSEDLDIFEGFEKEPDVEKYPHLVRWWRHVKSLR